MPFTQTKTLLKSQFCTVSLLRSCLQVPIIDKHPCSQPKSNFRSCSVCQNTVLSISLSCSKSNINVFIPNGCWMQFHQHTLIQQCHSTGNQDQKKSFMSIKSKGDFEHTVTDNARKCWSESPFPQRLKKEICNSVEKQTHFSKIQITSTNLAAKFGLHTTMGFPGVPVYTQTNIKSICLDGFLQHKDVWV